jgi:Raf kinase inhibitor-like YbhB/YbcL family protein
MAMVLKSDAFQHNGAIPRTYTCEGDDISPPLSWDGVPNNARSLVLIIDDPDAPDPDAPKMTWVHWVIYNLSPDTDNLPEAVNLDEYTPVTLQGVNDWRRTGYGGPCPPIGRHRYVHKLYALDVMLQDLNKPTKSDLLQAMEGHILDQAELIGTYEKTR